MVETRPLIVGRMARAVTPRTYFAIEVGYGLGHEFWGQGIATTALRLMTRVLEKAGYSAGGGHSSGVSDSGRWGSSPSSAPAPG